MITEDNVFDVLEIAGKISNSDTVIQKCKAFIESKSGHSVSSSSSQIHPISQSKEIFTSSIPELENWLNQINRLSQITQIIPSKIPKEKSSLPIETTPTPTPTYITPNLSLMSLSLLNQLNFSTLQKSMTNIDRLRLALRTLKDLLTVAKTLIQADRITLFLYDHETSQLCTLRQSSTSSTSQNVNSISLDPKEIPNLNSNTTNETLYLDESICEEYEIRIPCNLGIVGTVFTSGNCINSRDPSKDPRFISSIDTATHYRPKTLLSVPVLESQKVIGVIQALDKNKIDEFDAKNVNPSLEEKVERFFENEDIRLLGLVSDLVAAVYERIISESTPSLPLNLSQEQQQQQQKQHTEKVEQEKEQPLPTQTIGNPKPVWQNLKKRKREEIPIFHFKLSQF